MDSKELPDIISRMHKPPRRHRRGTRIKAANAVFTRWAVDVVKRKMNKEMRDLSVFLRPEPGDITEEGLLSLEWRKLVADVQVAAPTTWSILRSVATTPLQEKRNTSKNPDSVRTAAASR